MHYCHLFYASFQSLLEVIHSHLFSDHLRCSKMVEFVELCRVFHYAHLSLSKAKEFVFLRSLYIPMVLGVH